MITFSCSGLTSLQLRSPLFGYKTTIKYPFLIKEADDGSFSRYDYGQDTQDLDTRECECSFILSSSEFGLFSAFFFSDIARSNVITMVLDSSDGFYPFGCDKGNSGTYTVVANILENSGRLKNPLGYYHVKMSIANAGVYPEYVFIPASNNGVWSISAIGFSGTSYIPFPDSFASLDKKTNYKTIVTNGTNVFFNSIGSVADTLKSIFNLRLRAGKIQSLLKFISEARTRNMTIISTGNQLPFGYGFTSPYSVCLLNNTIEIVHEKYDSFKLSLTFGKL